MEVAVQGSLPVDRFVWPDAVELVEEVGDVLAEDEAVVDGVTV